MATLEHNPVVAITVKMVISESEARALDALVGYGDDAFIKAFYENLGTSYMKPHEEGLRSFLVSVRQQMPAILGKADAARKAIK